MKSPRFWMVVPALLLGGAVGLASAKLPQAPMATKKARADEEKAMDRVVDRYKKEKGVKTAAAKPPAKNK